jgi:glycosyltransferase involved in cell wall biosynthesis
MRVVFANRYFFPDRSATSQLLTDLAFELADQGHDVRIICSRQRYDDAGARLPSRDVVRGVRVHRVWTTRFGRDRLLGRALDYLTFYGASGWAMCRVLRPGDTLVAETDPPLLSIIGWIAVELRGARLINWLQDLFPEVATALSVNPLPRPLDWLLRQGRDRSLHAARTNVVLGERMRERLEELGVRREGIAVIENWAELDPPAPKPVAQSDLRAGLGLMDRFVIGYSGNLGRAHDWRTVLEAAEMLRDRAQFVFLMIGDGAGMRALKAASESRGLGNFRFLPYRPREALADALAAADVHWVSLRPDLEGLIVPSKFYGILAAGRPVIFIGDPAGELALSISACGCGFSVPEGDGKGLARVLVALETDASGRAHMGDRGRRCYIERYSAPRAFAVWRDLLKPPVPARAACSPSP